MKSTASELTRADGTPLRVLVVDDEENIAELLRMALRYEGWDVEVALTGSKAVGTAKRQRPTYPCSSSRPVTRSRTAWPG